ncbi:hypothetical protein TNCV_4944321 [Trichonephila clavipes]|nr:hypothetical protein TNCV_4944321 [Trichonephila clavipes]
MALNGTFHPHGSRHLRSVSRSSRMNGYATRRLYQERYPNRRVLHHTTFASVNRRLHETGSSTRLPLLFGKRYACFFS